MASISVPCPKVVALASGVGSKSDPQLNSGLQAWRISFPSGFHTWPALFWCLSVNNVMWSYSLQWPNNRMKASCAKVQAQVNEVVAEKSSSSGPTLDLAPLEGKEDSAGSKIPDAPSISAFISQVSDLVKLVDERDITELQLQQPGLELVIKKKEALQQPPLAGLVTMLPSHPQAVLPPPPPDASIPAAPATSPSPASPPPPKTTSSSHPPLKCPMAGTFYRCSAPGEPPFVKVGDKVQKGQVVCIIEAMKLMNEIEADQTGTVAEILVEDGKPVSLDMPLFVIVP